MEAFFAALCEQLKGDYPDLHSRLFPMPHRTPEDLRFLQDMERLEGRPLTQHEANLSIDQAIFIGSLPDHPEDCPLCPANDALLISATQIYPTTENRKALLIAVVS